MTQAELDALPEMGKMGYETRVIDGRTVKVAKMGPVGVMSNADDEPIFVRSVDGTKWRVGRYKGVMMKAKAL